MLLLGACARDVPPAPIAIDLERPGRYELSFAPRSRLAGVWPMIVVRDGRDRDRSGGEHPSAPDLRLRLMVTARGQIVRDDEIDSSRVIFGANWQPPDTCLLLPSLSLDARTDYRFVLTVVVPTHAFGSHATTMSLTWGAK